MFIARKSPATIESSTNWDDAWRAMQEGAGFGYTDDTPANLDLSDFNFSELPASCTIDGVEVSLDGSYDDSAGSGNLVFRVYLSWDDGSSWTSQKSTPNLTTTERRDHLGGHEQDWGHSWTRAELQAGAFQCRVQSYGTAILDVPVWELENVAVTVWYSETTALTINVDETLSLSDSFNSSKKMIAIEDQLTMSDGGSQPDLLVAGDAAESKYGATSTFENAITARQPMLLNAKLSLHEQGVITYLRITDESAATSTCASDDFKDANPIVVDWGDITFEGSYGNTVGDTARITCRNVATQSNEQGGTPQLNFRFGDWLHSKQVIDNEIEIRASTVDTQAGVFYERVVFLGSITGVEVVDDFVTIRARAHDRGDVVIPRFFVEDSLFSTADNEGTIAEEWRGEAVPIGFGRFSATARQDWPTLHPFGVRVAGEISHECFLPTYAGYKVPMMPIVHARKNYLYAGSPLQEYRIPTSVFLYGDYASPLSMYVRTTQVTEYDLQFPNENDTNTPHVESGYEKIVHYCVFEWDRDLDRPIAYCRDKTGDYISTSSEIGNVFYHMTSSLTSGGTGNACQWLYIAEGEDETTRAAGAEMTLHKPLASIALPPWGITPVYHATAVDVDHPGQPDPPQSTPFPYFTSQTRVLNKHRALDDDWTNHTQVGLGSGTSSSVYALAQHDGGSPRGRLVALRFSVLVDLTSTSAPSVNFYGRYHWGGGIFCKPSWNTWEYVAGAVENRGAPPWSAFVNERFYQINIMDRYDFKRQTPPPKPWQAAGDPTLYGWTGPWEFTSIWDDIYDPTNTWWRTYTTDCGIRVGAGDRIDIVGQWMDAIFEREYGKSTPRAYDRYNIRVNRRRIRGTAGFLSVYDQPPPRAAPPLASIGPMTIPTPEPVERKGTQLYVTGHGPVDPYGQICENTGDLIEHPLDIIMGLVAKYHGILEVYPTNLSGTKPYGSAFGSWTEARTVLNGLVDGADNYIMTVAIDQRTTISDMMAVIADQACCFVRRGYDFDNSVEQWQVFADVHDPATNTPSRLYRADGFGFRERDVVAGTFEASLTSDEAIPFEYVLEYGFHAPTGEYISRHSCTKDETTFAADATKYKTAVNAARANLIGRSDAINSRMRAETFQAPYIYRPEVAEAYLKWIIDKRRRRLVVVEFDTFVNAFDLRPGHIITFDDDVENIVEYPGVVGSSSWSAHYLQVISVALSKEADRVPGVHVVAVEVHTSAVDDF